MRPRRWCIAAIAGRAHAAAPMQHACAASRPTRRAARRICAAPVYPGRARQMRPGRRCQSRSARAWRPCLASGGSCRRGVGVETVTAGVLCSAAPAAVVRPHAVSARRGAPPWPPSPRARPPVGHQPLQRVEQPLARRQERPLARRRSDVLDEREAAARRDDAPHLPEGGGGVWHGAQHLGGGQEGVRWGGALAQLRCARAAPGHWVGPTCMRRGGASCQGLQRSRPRRPTSVMTAASKAASSNGMSCASPCTSLSWSGVRPAAAAASAA